MEASRRLVAWFRNLGGWRREHVAAWSGWNQPQQKGLSRFQRECESAVAAALIGVGSQLRHRSEKRIEGGSECQVTATLGDTGVTIWLYADSASLTGAGTDALFEEWSVRTPEELIQEVAAFAVGVATGRAAGVA